MSMQALLDHAGRTRLTSALLFFALALLMTREYWA